jgi:hypothetical protein
MKLKTIVVIQTNLKMKSKMTFRTKFKRNWKEIKWNSTNEIENDIENKIQMNLKTKLKLTLRTKFKGNWKNSNKIENKIQTKLKKSNEIHQTKLKPTLIKIQTKFVKRHWKQNSNEIWQMKLKTKLRKFNWNSSNKIENKFKWNLKLN